MTTIAYRAGIMASDSNLSAGGLNWCNVQKIKKVKGWLIGAAGPWDASEQFMLHFDPDQHIKFMKIALPPPSKDEGLGALMVSPSGKMYYTEDAGCIGKIRTRGFIAIGSGEKVAMAAMEMGATAVEAIKLAIKYDSYTGGRIQKIKL